MRGMKQKAITALMIATLACSQGTAVFAEEGNLSTVEDTEITTEETVENDAGNMEQKDAAEDAERPASEKDGTAESVSVFEESVDITKNEAVVLAEESVSVGDEIVSEGITYVVTKVASGTTHGTVKLTNGQTASGNITVPAMVLVAGGKYDVTELGDNAFKDNAGLIGIDLSATVVKTIGKYCFMNCSNLATVRFTDDTAIYLKLDTRAFANCISLKKVQFASVQILKAAIPFINSGVEEITIMNPVQLGANAFSGMKSGFVLNCPNKIPTVSNIDGGMFGTTQNVTFMVPNADLKSKMETKFASNKKVTVKLANEGVENVGVLVKDGTGQITAYTSLKEAFQGVSERSSDGPFALTVCQSSEAVTWPADVEMPDKAVTIDFANNSAELPANITLRAPLTIKNVLNFTNADKGVLCNLDAGTHAFVMENGGSYGFSTITGNNLTFRGTLPGSAPFADKVQIKGSSEGAGVTFENIGRSNYYYRLPEVRGFDKLSLNDAYMEAQAEQLTSLDIVMDDGGLKINGAAECDSITGNGELRFAEDSLLSVTNKVEGTFVGADGNEVHVHKYELKSDADKHWKECACHDKKDEAEHTGGQASCKEKAVCDVCGTAYGEYDLNHHEGGTEVRNRKEATTEANGYTGDTYCLGCNTLLEKGEEIPALTGEKKEDTRKDPQKENVVKKDNTKKAQPAQKNGKVKTGDTTSLWAWLLAFVASFGGIITVKRKRR